MAAQAVTANRLGDGAVVYLTAGEGWSEWIDDAEVSRAAEEAERLMAVARRAAEVPLVVEPYLIDVTVEKGAVGALGLREVIRSKGPTTHPHHGKQSVRG